MLGKNLYGEILLKQKCNANIVTSVNKKTKLLINRWTISREEGLETKPWSPTTRKQQVFYICKFFGQYHKISYQNCKEWLAAVPLQQLSKRRHMHSAVSSMARYLYKESHINEVEYEKIRKLYPRKPYNHQPKQRIIDKNTLESILAKLNSDCSSNGALLSALFLFLSETGLRIEEACQLKRADCIFGENGFVQVRNGKGGKARKTVLTSAAQNALKSYWASVKQSTEYCFLYPYPRKGNLPMDRHTIAKECRLIGREIGVKFSPHSFRHYAITNWARRCNSLVHVQQMAGHSDITTTQRYLHIEADESIAALYQ